MTKRGECKTQKTPGASKRDAIVLITLLGLVSLLGDVTYEGGRSIIGPYLSTLGASATIVGLVAGLGGFIGYALRLASGYIADKTRAYWPLTLLGYGMILCIPLLAIAGRWEIAALLVVLERAGKAIRTPSRDAILSHATKRVGRGFGFGLHEALDQVGAVIGPLVIAGALAGTSNYSFSLGVLAIPAVLCLLVLSHARSRYPHPEALEKPERSERKGFLAGLPRVFWWYSLFSLFSVAGLVNFALISFHAKATGLVSDVQIPLVYAIAMGVDAVVALIVGRLYDKIGTATLASIPMFSILVPFMVFSGSRFWFVLGMLVWGSAMGVHETIMRAAVADFSPIEKRGFAYGVFNTVYGLGWFVGGMATGILYDASPSLIGVLVVVLEAASLPFLARTLRGARR